ncbi:maleate cis-trans isomerase [Saccharolobus solfataricus]|uniref:Maleate cis-trans isomerase n=3 Tax=Saccharolobus solfataricus TaxID=2287 RepID=A0A0E3JT98_SACSO|nr:aspartate/glutamate racemase family protein [Saccharolobus solfataricus]AAK43043.1 Maleate cis-trans isomerase, probable (maiA) [Saccharolobus solfataricus P2]AKA73104.1 maleate cis-trans isomerase [Saccharolobus solfataricus]AKA75802.1 maleate cis-trans isomerase [Saccharolobus solfataricus]AKA78494.1 maleate cis-trans isomerase [Saccharolobus solfataricus]AZF67603.1 maleate cis-trans isomerase [Saccharolobus solfataricus]
MEWIKVGVIIPSSNTTVEYEFSNVFNQIKEYRITPHFSRIKLRNVTIEDLAEMERETERAASELSTILPQIISYACTTGSLFKGPKHHEEIIQRIEKIAKVPATATSGSVINALRRLDIKRLVLLTPYIEEVNKKEIEFFSKNGFEIVKSAGMGIRENIKIGQVTPEEVYNFAVNVLRNVKGDYDGVFISCTNLRTFEILSRLEKETKKPVISSNSATLWETLYKINLNIKVRELGHLFEIT